MAVEAKRAANLPGVGAYKEVDAAYRNLVMKRTRVVTVLPYKFQRFADEIANNKKWVPGPGAYNIGPPLNKN